MSRIARSVAGLLVVSVTLFAAEGERVSMPPNRADLVTHSSTL